jgi:histidinol dehydrogenase
VVLIAVDLTAERLADIEKEVDEQASALPRVDIIRVSISKSLIVKVKTVEEAFVFSNEYAPEHLILHLDNAAQRITLVENAGSVFVGPYTPERLVAILFFQSVQLTFFLFQLWRLRVWHQPHTTYKRLCKAV